MFYLYIVFERKWEVDSLASFLGFSYQYWNATGDASFVQSNDWMDAVEVVIQTIHEQQEPTFNEQTGRKKSGDPKEKKFRIIYD